MSPYEKIELLEAIRAQVQAAWRTDEIRRQKPTPQVMIARLYTCASACGSMEISAVS
jgi:phosphoenolpyruvate carboxylase